MLAGGAGPIANGLSARLTRDVDRVTVPSLLGLHQAEWERCARSDRLDVQRRREAGGEVLEVVAI